MKEFDEELENDAVHHFLGNNEGSRKSFVSVDQEYYLKGLTYLTHLQDLKQCIKYIFISGVKEQFVKQLQFLILLANHFRSSVIFISLYSTNKVISRYICSVSFNNQLLLINYLGLQCKRDLVDVLTTLTKSGELNFIRRTYASHNELLKKVIIALNLYYRSIGIERLCFSNLFQKMMVKNTETSDMRKIRRSHFEKSIKITLIRLFQANINEEQTSLETKNLYLYRYVMKKPEQALFT